MWEVFDPCTAHVKVTVPFKWMARFITHHKLVGPNYWEYGKRGEG